MEKENANNTGYKVLNWIVGILLLVALIFNGLQFYQIKHLSEPEVIRIYDTTIIRKDSIITKTKFKTKHDTIIDVQYIDTTKKDTINIKDTIQIPIEHKVDSFTIKRDSLTVTEKIHHSGFHSEIDSVEFSYDWHYTVTKKTKKIGLVWNIGLYTGYGIGFKDGQFYHSPEIGVGGSIGIGGIIETKKTKK